ncbi:MAG: acylphosphatase [Candidatus Diapherotrites archaeon]|nr:acylphosphatase [Candidatus Diapherotrites archaeon]
MEKRIEAIVSGHVQGVGFRFFVLKTAKGLGLKGWVKNLPNGKVQTIAEGPEKEILEFLEHVKKGFFLSRVDKVEHTLEKALNEFNEFEVRY